MNPMLRNIHALYVLAWRVATSRYPFGTNIFEKKWDHLIILDACRVDAIEEVAPEYEFLQERDTIWSVGSTSKEWIEQTFTQKYSKEIEKTAYITSNPYSDVLAGDRDKLEYANTGGTFIESTSIFNNLINDKVLSHDDLAHLEYLHIPTEEHPENGYKQILPEEVTDYSIKANRKNEFDRVVSHYMQPHQPYYSSSKEYESLSDLEKHPISYLKNGHYDQVWEAYLDNLRYVLDSVKILLENIDGSVIITSDHGEMMGELGLYAHPAGHIHPKLRKVPWIRTQAENKRNRNPDVHLTGIEKTTEIPEAQLEALGYR